jgi:hypothetical protein
MRRKINSYTRKDDYFKGKEITWRLIDEKAEDAKRGESIFSRI